MRAGSQSEPEARGVRGDEALPIVQIQAGIALATATIVIALSGSPAAWGTLLASGVGLILSAGLAIRYRRFVRGRVISAYRAQRDEIMGVCLLVGLGGPVIIAAAVLVLDWGAPLSGAAAHVAVISANAVFAAMLTSSFFDWYLIRAFRDGVLGAPACQTTCHDNETALYYSRTWIAQRTMAELIGWGGSTNRARGQPRRAAALHA